MTGVQVRQVQSWGNVETPFPRGGDVAEYLLGTAMAEQGVFGDRDGGGEYCEAFQKGALLKGDVGEYMRQISSTEPSGGSKRG